MKDEIPEGMNKMKKGRRKAGRKKILFFIAAALMAMVYSVVKIIDCSGSSPAQAIWAGPVRLDILIYEILFLTSGYALLIAIMSLYHRQRKKWAYGSR